MMFKDKIADIDFSIKTEVERFFYELSPEEWDIFDDLDMSNCEVISYQFEWCIQAIIWITGKVSELKVKKNAQVGEVDNE